MQNLVFLHVPKTAGMSFSAIVLRQFPRCARFHADAGDLAAFEARWLALAAERRAEARCIHGHLPFGVHQVLPEPACYVTLLRDPVDRVVSAYSYALRRPEIPAHRELVQQRTTLHDYVTSELSDDVHEAQTRALAGGAISTGAPGRDALDRALVNLEGHFAVVGLCERFDETALLCRRVLGWRHVHYVTRNRNRHRVRLTDVAPTTIAASRERNPLDVELHSVAAARFAAAIEERSISVAELRAFRRRNRAYDMARRLLETPWALVRDARAVSLRAPTA